MKKIILTILLSISVLHAGIESDKVKHIYAGVIIYGGCVLFGKAIDSDSLNYKTCLIPVVGAAVGKEVYDYYHPESHSAEFMDIAATMAIPLATYTFIEW